MKNRILFVLIISLVLVIPAAAQSTEFTYQGKLNDGAVAANANYDFEFRLFDALAAGVQVGPLLTRTNVAVAGGIFSVKLDFGGVFPGADRFLEVRVRTAGGAGYTVLDPRQKLNSAPYGIKSLVAETANNALQLGGVPANQYLTTTSGNTNYIRNSGISQPGASFNIGGAANIDGGLSVASSSGSLAVGGNASVQGNLTVNGLLTANLPAGDSSYVQNRTFVQTGTTNFNISGNGRIGGTLNTTGNLSTSGDITMNNTGGILQFQSVAVNKGYVQISGDNLRLGTNAGNATGNLIVRMNGTDQITVNPAGNINLSGTANITSTVTGAAPLTPLCYGSTASAGTGGIARGTSNASVTRLAEGAYRITCSGLNADSFVMIAGLGSAVVYSVAYHAPGQYNVFLWNRNLNEQQDAKFTFLTF